MMYYDMITELINSVKKYEHENSEHQPDVQFFVQWMSDHFKIPERINLSEPDWDGKANGRSADSMINSSLVHLYRYAKQEAKLVTNNTLFSTSDDFIYLINLVSYGSMTKTALIKLNVHEKSVGMQIVNRLINNGLVGQTAMLADKRNRMIHITEKGKNLLNNSMAQIRQASKNVTEPLSNQEKMDLIRLLNKLENFHEFKQNRNKSLIDH